ncbi:MAG: precorrin-6A reductase [Roseburia sp.]|nr:precorrin-6A reductase [Roseburia sp.]
MSFAIYGKEDGMAIIIIFGGTTEGRELAEAFEGTRLEVHLCVATDYGASLLPRRDNIRIHTGRLEAEDMERLLQTEAPDMVVDATHPYAAAVTENIREVCRRLSCPLIRILRERNMFPEITECYRESTLVDSVEEAAAFLANTQGKILITTGSKELEKYTVIADYQNRCVARVLPILSVMEKCAALGFTGRNLIAMQGPFSEEMNYQLLKQTGCVYLVTKASGKEGGYEEKCRAAMRAGVKLIVVQRPGDGEAVKSNAFQEMSLWDAVEYLSGRWGLEVKRTAYLIGIGPGAAELFTEEAVRYIQEADCVIGAERVLKSCRQMVQKPQFCAYRAEEVAAFLEEHREYRKVALVYSGDIGFYSGATGMWETLEEFRVVPVSGISTAQYFLNRIGVAWQDVELVSRHGRAACLIPLLLRRGRVFALLGREGEAEEICRSLLELGLEKVRVVVGEALSYPEERIVQGTPRELLEMKFGSLSVMYLEWEECRYGAPAVTPGLPDACFSRNQVTEKKVPMTKQGVRILSLAKLELTEDAVVYDIGAGTGSVSIEAARLCSRGMVYAVEQRHDAIELLERNRICFHAENMRIVEGSAPEALKTLPAPTHVFMGGSSGRLIEIIRAAREKNPSVRFVVNAVTMETMAQIGRIPEKFPEYQDMEILQVPLTRSRHVGEYHMMHAENPVMIASFGGINDGLVCVPKRADGSKDEKRYG